MSLPYVKYIATGFTGLYLVPFPYLDQSHVFVTVNGTQLTTSQYTFLTHGSLNIATNPATGAVVEIERRTPADALTAYQAGSPLTSEELSTDSLQALYRAQEIEFKADRSLKVPAGSTGVDADLPAPVALKPLVWSADATHIENGDTALTGDMLLRGNLAASTGAQLVKFTRPETGAVLRTLYDEVVSVVRPEQFGAVGDGVTDDTSAIRKAITAAGIGGRVSFRSGKTYLISDTLTIDSNFVELYGSGHLDRSAKVKMAAGINKPMVLCQGGNKAKVNGLCLVGSSTTGTPLTSQSCIKIDTTNNIEVRNCFLGSAHNLIDIQGVSFYTRLENVYFADCTNAWINGFCSVANGFDITMTQCNGTTSQSAPYAFYFDGLGSIIMSDCQFSPSHCTIGGLFINNLASLSGACFFNNVVFELGAPGAPALRLKGTSSSYVKCFHFTNCYFYGDASVSIDYATKCHWTNCFFTGTGDGASGRNAVRINNVGTDLYFNGCAYEVTNVGYAVDNAASAVSLYLQNPRYNGSNIFVELSNMTTAANMLAFSCVGGNVGTNANPIRLPDEVNRTKFIRSFGENNGPTQELMLTGSFAATGVVTVAHGITNAHLKTVQVAAWGKGGSGQMLPLTVNYVDGTNVQINNATSGQHYRLFLRYTSGTDANW